MSTFASQNKANVCLVDAIPGSGKTDGALRLMEKRINKKKGILIYAGPTCKLLKEVEQRLLTRLGVSYHPSVRPIHSGSVEGSGVSMCDEVLQLLQSEVQKGQGAIRKVAAPGSVILITHKTFMTLPKSVRNKKNITVIFDEAYKCVFDPLDIRLQGDDAELFKNHLGGVYDNSEYMKLQHVSSEAQIKKDIEKLSARKAAKHLFELLKTVRQGTSEVYVRVTGETSQKFEFQEVKVPTFMFHGWKRVYLMSAYLRHTQIWALLTQGFFVLNGEWMHNKPYLDENSERQWKHERIHMTKARRAQMRWVTLVELEDVTTTFIPNYAKRIEAFRERYRNSIILSLTSAPMLSRNTLSSVLVNENEYESKQEELREMMSRLKNRLRKDKVKLTRNDLVKYAAKPGKRGEYQVPESVKPLVKWFKGLDIVSRTPYKWYLRHALAMASRWQQKNNCEDIQVPVVRNGKVIQHNLIAQTPLVLLNVREQAKAKEHQEFSNITLLPFECSGINDFRDHQVVIFLAALNAKPSHRNFYRAIMPWYDPRQDYAVATAMQAITRGALRKVDCNDPTLIIVADDEMGNAVHQRLFGLPKHVLGSQYGIPSVRAFEFAATTAQRTKQFMLSLEEDKEKKDKRVAAKNASIKKNYANVESKVRKNSPYFNKIQSLSRRVRVAQDTAKTLKVNAQAKAELHTMEQALRTLKTKHSNWAKDYRKKLRAQVNND